MDVDRFKLVNDSLGHRTGDELLRVVAKRLAGCVRSQDLLARVSGDEFAILVDDADLAMTAGVADRVVEALRLPVQLGSYDLYSPCSVGLVVAPGRYELAEDLLRDADIAMYRAKKDGGRGLRRVHRADACRGADGAGAAGGAAGRAANRRAAGALPAAAARGDATHRRLRGAGALGSIPGTACCRPDGSFRWPRRWG